MTKQMDPSYRVRLKTTFIQSSEEVLDWWVQFRLKHGFLSSKTKCFLKSGSAPSWVCLQLQSAKIAYQWLQDFTWCLTKPFPSLRTELTSSILSYAGALCSCRYFYCFPEVWGLQENWLENCLCVLQKKPKPKTNAPSSPPFLILQRVCVLSPLK